MWPHELDTDGEPPPDWPCVCGQMYPNGDLVTYESLLPRRENNLKCPRCNEVWENHPTDNCKGPDGRCRKCNKPMDDHPTEKCENRL